MKYDPLKHHRRSIRLKGYDYTQPGAYFVTACTHQREALFGEVVEGKMQVNECGRATTDEWQALPRRFPHMCLDEFVVMPNHIHAIIEIVDDGGGRGTTRRAPTIEQFGKPVAGSLPTIVRTFKSEVTKRVNEIRQTSGAPVWQRNYYEHIVRNERELNAIRRYIRSNPLKWALDRDNLENTRRLPPPASTHDYVADAGT
jgi:REP-associated tyrosine transposase